ncbi:MAG TPA: DUF4199 domain-containing protein [Gemmatimonadales bacterium]|nr:DUF4199 domain-containing protein [Gemmatimonadales bacterium]
MANRPPAPSTPLSARRLALKWGVLLALAIAAWTLVVHLLGIYTTRIQYASGVDIAALIVPIVVLSYALKEFARDEPRPLQLRPAILFGIGVAAVSAPLTVAALWYYHHYVNPDWLTYLAHFEGQKLAAAGGTPEQVGARIAAVRLSGSDRNQIIGGLIGTLLMGAVVSTLIANVIRYRDRRAAAK